MIFDIAASIGTKRKYYVLNGQEVSPFTLGNFDNYEYNYLGFLKKIDDDAIVLYTSERSGGQVTFYGSYEVTNIPDIDEYSKLCLVISTGNKIGSGSLHTAKFTVEISSTTINIGGSMQQIAEVELPQISSPNIYEIDVLNSIKNINNTLTKIPEDAKIKLTFKQYLQAGSYEEAAAYIELHHLYAE